MFEHNGDGDSYPVTARTVPDLDTLINTRSNIWKARTAVNEVYKSVDAGMTKREWHTMLNTLTRCERRIDDVMDKILGI